MRTYTDREGIIWNVYCIPPTSATTALPDNFRGGWLCFECSDVIRRLAPIPSDWESCDKERLELYRAKALMAKRTER